MRVEEMDGVKKTTEDYLEAILMIQERQGYVRSVDVEDQLGVTKPSVTYTTKRLKEKNYITTDHAGMLVLTEEGMKIASQTYERHKKITVFFTSLGVNPEQARTDACKIEHDISDESFNALCRFVDEQSAEEGTPSPETAKEAQASRRESPSKKEASAKKSSSSKKGSASGRKKSGK